MSDSFSSLPKISAPIWRTTFLNKMQDRKIRHIKKKMIFKKKTILLTHQHHSSSPPRDKLWQCVAMIVFTSVRSSYPSDQIWLKSLLWNKGGWQTPSNGQDPMLLKRYSTFVFYLDFTIIPKNTVWIVEDDVWAMLKRKWQQLQKLAEHADQEVEE